MSENGSIEEKVTGNWSDNLEAQVSEIHTLTQDVVNEPIKRFITPLTFQLQEMVASAGTGNGDNAASEPLSQGWFWYQFW